MLFPYLFQFTIEDAVTQGGFAFAALVLGSLLVWSLRLFQSFMHVRESYISRLLDRLDKSEAEHGEMVAALKGINEATARTASSLQEIHVTLARLNGRK